MGRRAGSLAATVGLTLIIYAGAAAAADRPDFNVTFGPGYRVDDFSWSIAGTTSGTNPNILSELTWRDNKIAELRGGGEVWLHDRPWGALVQLSYGQIVDGEVQDSDYAGDNRTGEFSRSFSTPTGDTWGADVGLAYRTRVYDSSVDKYALLIFSAGYTWQEQDLRAKEGVQVVPAYGPFSGLNTHYDTHWEGPWIGAQMEFETGDDITLSLGIKYAWTDYSAEADWNLRDDLAHPVSFRHDATGGGTLVTAGLRRDLGPHWTFGALIEVRDWTTDAGVDRSYLVDSDTGAVFVADTRLNRVDWLSRSFSFQAQYRY